MFGFLNKNRTDDVSSFEDKAFKAWGISQPNNAQRLRLRLAFAAASVAIISDNAGANAHVIIERMQSKIVKSSNGIDVSIGDLFDVDVPKHSIDFSMNSFISAVAPSASGLGEKTKLNGLAAIDGLFAAFGQAGASWVHSRSQGPFGPLGAAALFLHDISVGGSSDAQSSMAVAEALASALKDITK